MKNLMKIGLVVAMLFAMAFSAFANDSKTADFALRVMTAKGKTVSFSLIDAKEVHLSLRSQNDELLFEENISAAGSINRTYNLDALPNGEYTLTAETAFTISQYNVEVADNSAVISEDPSAEISKPVVVNKKGRVSVSIINKEQTPIEIAIYDENNEELYTEIIAGKKVSLVKMFDFNSVPGGKYTFVTKYSNKTFTDTVSTQK
jgi:hypothetical protein